MKRFWAGLEYFIAVLLIIGGINTSLQKPEGGEGVLKYLDNTPALVTFGFTVFCLGATIIYGRTSHTPRARQIVFMVIYLLMVFATVYDMVVVGLDSLSWLDSVIIGSMAAACYLHARLEGKKLWANRHATHS